MKRVCFTLLLLLTAVLGTACDAPAKQQVVPTVSCTDNAEVFDLNELLTAATEPPSNAVSVSTAATTQPPTEQETTSAGTYVLNTNTKRFHYPDCPSITDIKEKNKQVFVGSRDEVVAQGYLPCQRCNP